VKRFALVIVACALPLCGARAQKVGVALSGGAARGLAHIGVLHVLEEEGVPVDLITGTSMGSVVGGLYAVGYTAAQLDTIVRTEDWFRLLTDPVDRRDLAVDRKFTEVRVFARSFAELVAPPTMRHHAETSSTMITDLGLPHHALAQQFKGISLR